MGFLKNILIKNNFNKKQAEIEVGLTKPKKWCKLKVALPLSEKATFKRTKVELSDLMVYSMN